MRAVFEAWFHPPRARVDEVTRTSGAQRDAWTVELLRDVPDAVRQRLALLPTARAFIEVEPGGPKVRFEGPEGLVVRVLHTGIGPFDDVVDEHGLSREERTLDASRAVEVPLLGRYGPGQRVWIAAEVSSSIGPLRVAFARLAVPSS
jgi:hypothetical protein